MAKDTRHVVPSTSGGWSVRKEGASRASKNFARQAEAEEYGKELARKAKSDVFIHGKNGMVRDHTSYKK
jgi:transcriptional regulator of NAD metabolism